MDRLLLNAGQPQQGLLTSPTPSRPGFLEAVSQLAGLTIAGGGGALGLPLLALGSGLGAERQSRDQMALAQQLPEGPERQFLLNLARRGELTPKLFAESQQGIRQREAVGRAGELFAPVRESIGVPGMPPPTERAEQEIGLPATTTTFERDPLLRESLGRARTPAEQSLVLSGVFPFGQPNVPRQRREAILDALRQQGVDLGTREGVDTATRVLAVEDPVSAQRISAEFLAPIELKENRADVQRLREGLTRLRRESPTEFDPVIEQQIETALTFAARGDRDSLSVARTALMQVGQTIRQKQRLAQQQAALTQTLAQRDRALAVRKQQVDAAISRGNLHGALTLQRAIVEESQKHIGTLQRRLATELTLTPEDRQAVQAQLRLEESTLAEARERLAELIQPAGPLGPPPPGGGTRTTPRRFRVDESGNLQEVAR